MKRAAAAIVIATLLTAPALAQSVKQIGEFRSWSAYSATEQTGAVCFALTQPTEITPQPDGYTQAYLYLTHRPSSGVALTGGRACYGREWIEEGSLDGASCAAALWPGSNRITGGDMDRGTDFLKSQINNAVMQHQTFIENLVDHEKQADDARYRALCARFIPKAQSHQRMLEDYQAELGAEAGTAKKVLGKALGMARDLADSARESDFLRLVGDIVTSRQSEDTFKTFREAGKALGIARLQQLGDMGERDHDEYHREANRLAQQMFIEHVREGDTTGLNISSSASTGLGSTGASASSTTSR